MRKLKGIKPEAGFTLIETLIATIIFALVVLAFGTTYVNGKLLVANQGARRQALLLAQSRLEELKLNDFTTLAGQVGNPVATTITIDNTIFSRTSDVVYVNVNDYTQIVGGPTDALRLTVTVTDNDAELDFDDVVVDTTITSIG